MTDMTVIARLRERLSHNNGYLTRPLATRVAISVVTHGRQKSEEWLRGEHQAIIDENEWLEALLKDFAS